ncbi:MAG: transcriptional activator NhaR [Gammaproteobacteria bacterium]|nr:transcriptional activator NhaR [Gammaproteobacteria bacterium]MBI5617531.1 transcriptional activator NhaR [Gammaproteobacteria bacterium]
MRHLNYSHLLYFWTVAKEGSIARAANVLHLTPQTISGQLKLLDDAVGERLFQRAGRRLVLSDTGQLVFQYADEIFALGAELAHVVRGRAPDAPLTLNVGIVDSIPKLVAYRVIEPALRLEDGLRIACNEGKLETLLSDLAVHRLDLVLADGPVPSGLNVRAYNHLLGTSGTTFFAAPELAKRHRARFPQSLKDAPFLLPARDLPLRRLIDEWSDEMECAPRVVGEFADSALMMSFGQAGAGVLPGPTAIEKEICAMFKLSVVGRAETIVERFYAISPERKLKHPAVVAISEQARELIFGA